MGRVAQAARVRSQSPESAPRQAKQLPQLEPLREGEHPMAPAVRWAKACLPHVEGIADYSCNFVKRERVDGVLGEHQYAFMKVRHRPLSIYLHFQAPEAMKGQEVIYVEGRNDGNLLAHGAGWKSAFGTLSLAPDSALAMQGNRHPITKAGILNLVRELISVGSNDVQYGECEGQYFPGAKVDGRSATCMQFTHPTPRREFRFHLARIYVDDEYKLPIRFEAYTWPATPGGKPRPIEEYTFRNLKFNNGFTDRDFDPRNPAYSFQ